MYTLHLIYANWEILVLVFCPLHQGLKALLSCIQWEKKIKNIWNPDWKARVTDRIFFCSSNYYKWGKWKMEVVERYKLELGTFYNPGIWHYPPLSIFPPFLGESSTPALCLCKGTVSRDFFDLVFSTKQLLLAPLEMSQGRFDFFCFFAELYDFKNDSPVLGTPGSRPKILGLGKFFEHK